MIVRDLVGGGGRVKLVFTADLDPVSGGDALLESFGAIAGGPMSNFLSFAESEEPSLPWISVEAPGVGGKLGRGMVSYRDKFQVSRVQFSA